MTEDDFYIQKLAKNQNPPITSGRAKWFKKINFDELVFLPAQLAKKPVDYFLMKNKIKAETIIGKRSKKPLKVIGPAIAAGMSFGALSEKAKIALAKGAAMANTASNTGEGGMLAEERKNAKILIAQYSTGRFGVNEEYLKKADAIEIKIGQGAKPGQGGLLPGEKVTKKIAQTRSNNKRFKEGETIHSPATHPDIASLRDLKEKIKWLKETTGGKPIILKLAASRLEKDIPLAVKADPDVIAIDGGEGGTGAAPSVMLNHTGIPSLAALIEARQILNSLKAKQELWIGGGFIKGADMAKAIALGADLVFVGSALLKAMGCISCGLCFQGKCPKGIATQDPQLEKNLNLEEAAKKISNFFLSTREETKMIAAACGYQNIYQLQKSDLASLSPLISQITGIPLVGISRLKKHFKKREYGT